MNINTWSCAIKPFPDDRTYRGILSPVTPEPAPSDAGHGRSARSRSQERERCGHCDVGVGAVTTGIWLRGQNTLLDHK